MKHQRNNKTEKNYQKNLQATKKEKIKAKQFRENVTQNFVLSEIRQKIKKKLSLRNAMHTIRLRPGFLLFFISTLQIYKRNLYKKIRII